jgi:hypothetical protein
MLRLRKNIMGSSTAVNYDWQHDKPWDLSRNFIAKNFLDSGAEWLLMIDTDVIMPPDGLEELYRAKLPIVSGLYWRRHPKVFPELFRFRPGTTQYDPVPDEQIHVGMNEVDGVGMGFCLLHRRVFENLRDKVKKMTIPSQGVNVELYEFFKFTPHEAPFVSEDLFFCIQAKLAGWKIYVDTRIRCGHIASSLMIQEGRPTWSPLEGGTAF